MHRELKSFWKKLKLTVLSLGLMSCLTRYKLYSFYFMIVHILCFQVQSRMSDLGVQLNDLDEARKHKDDLSKWIEINENNIAALLKQPPKYRQEAFQAEMKVINDMKDSVTDKLNMLGGTIPDDNDLKTSMESLEGHIQMLSDTRYNQQLTIDDFIYSYKDCQTWLEKINKKLTELDETLNLNSEERLNKLNSIINTYQEKEKRQAEINERHNSIVKIVGEMDRQQIIEQKNSFERRTSDIWKRIERKKQIFEMAQYGYLGTLQEIGETKEWIKRKHEELKSLSNKQITTGTLSDFKITHKEIEGKMLLIESLETKVESISSDLEISEYENLKKNLISVFEEQKGLSEFSKTSLKTMEEKSESNKKYITTNSEISTWLKAKSTEFAKLSEYDPLKSVSIEKKISQLKKDLNEIGDYEESHISQMKLTIMGLLKTADSRSKEDLEKQAKDMEESVMSLKTSFKNHITYLEDELDFRRDFESDLEKCSSWIHQAETILTTEVRGTINIAILDDHHNKFKRLKKAEDDNRVLVTEVFETASKILEKLSDADRISLQTQLDEICDKQNHIADTINAKISSLVRNIEIYKSTAQKIEDSVNHLTEIQTQIRLLNKPIGYRVEDAEDVLEAYGKILENLKAFKIQMEDLQKTAGTNVSEVRALLGQQEELISAIENQMGKIRSLISTRHHFMTMVTGITSFIIKHTEVVKQVERSSISPMEKVKKYDESILKLKDCETQLSLASDKGQQIANEGSAGDRNQISHQLQSLKTQILALKKAIEKKRDEHIRSVQEHNKIFAELERHLEWIQENEASVRERPLLTTTVEDVDKQILIHQQLTQGIMDYVEKIKDINEVAKKENEIPASVFEMLSSASAMIQTMPRELEERKQYFENQKNFRLQYDSLVERLNNWIEEAQIKLRPIDSGVDFDNLEIHLEEHKKYFSQESKLKELLHSIHDMANKIWASLAPKEQDKINHEQEFLTQLVKNTLNSASTCQTQFEENIKKWKAYCDALEKARTLLLESKYEPEVPSSLPSVKTSIQKIDFQIKQVQGRKTVMDQFAKDAKKIESAADSINRLKISKNSLAIQNEWKIILTGLNETKETLVTLALQWEDFEQKFKSFDNHLTVYNEQFSHIESSFTSIKQMSESQKTLKSLLEDVKNMDGRYKDVQILSDNVIR